MIKIKIDPTFTHDVPITVPGVTEPGTLSLTFKYKDRDEYKAFLAWCEEDGDKPAKTFEEALPEFVAGWGLPEPFDQKNINIFLKSYPAAYLEIFQFYSKMLFASRVKN